MSTEERQLRYDYTAAYRLPHLVRDLGGWKPFWGTWTIAQYVPALILIPSAIYGRNLWMPAIGSLFGAVGVVVVFAVILVILPIALGFAVGHVRFQGRSPARALSASSNALVIHLARRARPAPALHVHGRHATAAMLPDPRKKG